MKKILSLILTLFCVLSLVGCGRSMDDIIKNESSITGVVEEVYNNSILISIQTDAYPLRSILRCFFGCREQR